MAGAREDAKPRLRVAFCHPDLGIGGAERLVVDAAYELAASHGARVHIVTAHYDPSRCFPETRDERLEITVAGSWFPRAVLGRLHALCAVVRCVFCALLIAWRGLWTPYDAVFVDQVSAVVPILLWLTSARVLFYCHFPDQLLATRGGWLRSLYRAPLDRLEEATTGMAHRVLVNSRFTAGVFAATFRGLRAMKPAVLYPSVAVPTTDALAAARASSASDVGLGEVGDWLRACGHAPLFLSLNRYERKKGVELAVHALAELLRTQPECGACLVIAGGYDPRVAENVAYAAELESAADAAGPAVASRVHFLRSVTDAQRAWLLGAATAVLYTPEHEHFGIVPLEAGGAGLPVLAADSGGPTESVRHNETGFLLSRSPRAWADAMAQLLMPGEAKCMGAAARAHVQSTFSRQRFGDALVDVIRDASNSRRT